MSRVFTACDLCGGIDFRTVYPGTIQLEVDDPEEIKGKYFSSSRQNALHFPIVACVNCGLVMQNPHDDEETLTAVYTTLQDKAYEAEYANRLALAEQRVGQINKHSLPTKLLDIGCATGIFAGAAQRSGWQATGIDLSQWAIDLARQNFPDATFNQCALADASFPDQSFDVITMWDVLEHVGSPSQTLSILRPWLKPGGWLVLNVPDISSWPARLMGRKWVLLLREHLWYFSRPSLERLLEKTGFNLIYLKSNSVKFSIANIFTRLQQYPGIARTAAQKLSAVRGVKSFSLQFPIGEMNAFIQKKN